MPTLLSLLLLAGTPRGADAGVPFIGEKLPLPLTVKTPEELNYKAMTERQYLLVNLLIGAKAAWDAGDWETAATKWEAVERLPQLPADVDVSVRSFARVARERAGGRSAPLSVNAEMTPSVTITPMEPEPSAPSAAAPSTVTVSVSVSGGGTHGPGGAVVVLRRLDGTTPRPRAARVRAVVQKDKRFVPHVLAVPLGATVEFRNDDEFFHNVFSITKTNAFDLGLYKAGDEKREQVFSNPGPVHLLCNIHSQMNGWLYVSDSPWFSQADAQGRAVIKNVPPGSYEVEVWHEWAAAPTKQKVQVSAGMAPLALSVDGDRRAPAFVPDKSGKPRQPQLGY